MAAGKRGAEADGEEKEGGPKVIRTGMDDTFGSDRMVTIFMGTLLLILNRLKTLMHRLPAAPDKKMSIFVGGVGNLLVARGDFHGPLLLICGKVKTFFFRNTYMYIFFLILAPPLKSRF